MTHTQGADTHKHGGFAETVLGVLFSLTFGEALERGLGGVNGFSRVDQLYEAFRTNPGVWLGTAAQLFAFLLTLGRFYLGAYRFITLHPGQTVPKGPWEVMWDAGNVALLFIGFYVSALLVGAAGPFLWFVAVLHVLDLIWFGLGGPFLNRTRATAKVRDCFIAFDVVTVAVAGVIGLWFVIKPFAPFWLQIWTALLLVAMFAADVLWLCRDFYFNKDKWLARYPEPTGGAS
jgi:hypothetical protein